MIVRGLVTLILAVLMSASAVAQPFQAGDTIEINVYQDPKLDRRVLIGRDGSISVPLAGRIRAAGRNPADIEAELKRRLQKNYTEPLDISVGLVQPARPEPAQPLRSVDDELKPRVFVTGEVTRPGSFPIGRRITVVQAIAQAGGLGPFAARKRIQIRRQSLGEELVFPFDYDAFLNGVVSVGNVDLRPGDVIVVPEQGLFE